MSFELALKLTEIMLAMAFIQQSLEHLAISQSNRFLFLSRIALSISLIIGFYTPWICLGLLINFIFILHRYNGPYNGGSDRMGLLILCCLCLTHFLPHQEWREVAFGYLAVQLILSYFISGWVKIINSDWRSGRALQDVFLFSAYPASENMRLFAQKPTLLFFMSCCVIVFELIFPLALATQLTLIIALVIAAVFHLANAVLFGLNRFFWIWVSAYPSLLWLQQRAFDIQPLF